MTSDNPPPERRGARRDSRRGGPPSRLRRRIGAAARMIAALALAGGVYAGFSPELASAQESSDGAALSDVATDGKELFDTSCVTCHGPNAQGVEGRGPSLIGVGAASVDFQVSSGRMPMARQESQAQRKEPVFTGPQIQALAQYVQELGGGPVIPEGPLTPTGDDDAVAEATAAGGELYRLNCASCHTYGGGGGALSSGKWAPALGPATEQQIYAAMLTGPQNMPVFGDNQLTPDEKRQVIAYVKTLQQDKEPGGWHLGRLGPVTEGLAIFLVGITALVFATLWIAGKS